LAALLCFLLLLDGKNRTSLPYFGLGLLVGLVVSVKLNGAILLLLFFPLFLYQQRQLSPKIMIHKLFLQAFIFLSGSVLVFGGVYYVHGMLGQNVVNSRYYAVSAVYAQILADKQSADPLSFPLILRDNLRYSHQYEAAVPQYKPADPNENGSLPYTWPFGNKTINYRWERANGQTKYLYLVGNPVIWFSGLVGLVSAIGLVMATLALKRPITNKNCFSLLLFCSRYISSICVLSFLYRGFCISICILFLCFFLFF
jgi:dolichyl-phosphate-mannose--protein O-mannosyl transferase